MIDAINNSSLFVLVNPSSTLRYYATIPNIYHLKSFILPTKSLHKVHIYIVYSAFASLSWGQYILILVDQVTQ